MDSISLRSKNLVSDLLFTYNGKMTVYPRSDYHRDVTNQDPLRITQSNKAFHGGAHLLVMLLDIKLPLVWGYYGENLDYRAAERSTMFRK